MGPEHTELCPTLLGLAKAYRIKGDTQGGHALLRRSLGIAELHVAGTASTCTASTSTSAAFSPPRKSAAMPRDAAESLTAILEELARSETALAEAAAETALETAHASLESALARLSDGEAAAAEALPIPEIAAAEARRAGASASAAHLERALELRERAFGSRHEDLLPLLQKLGDAWAGARELSRAVAVLERAVDIAGAASLAGDSIASLLSALSRQYEQQGETAKAAQSKQRAAALVMQSAREGRRS